jgi:hypothetical protein
MKYSEVRDSIKDGSIVFFKAHRPMQKLVAFFTRGKFSHVAFVFWMHDDYGNKRLFLVDSAPGGRKVALFSAYVGKNEIEVVDIGLNWNDVAEFALDKTGHVKYSYLDALILGIERTFKFELVKKPFGEVCSEFVARILRLAGIKVNDDIDPNKLYQDLLDMDDTKVTIISK